MNKDQEYKDYIDEHISNVKQVWEDLQLFLMGQWSIRKDTIKKIDYFISHHDKTKYSSEEFQGYRQWFYPVDEIPKNKKSFDDAWNHHQKFNPHHWQYWLMWKPEGTKPLNMDLHFIIEMLCDWTAMSYKFGDTPEIFYNKNKDSMLLSFQTRELVETWLPLFTVLAGKRNKK